MSHLSEESRKLSITTLKAASLEALIGYASNFRGVCVLRLPSADAHEFNRRLKNVGSIIAKAAAVLGPEATLITLGENIDLVAVHAQMPSSARYQSWVAIERLNPLTTDQGILPGKHFGALIHTKYQSSLKHTKTRLAYTFCPACDKTTKDYGGKKHTYHAYGTLLSDVWRDIAADLSEDISLVIDRFADFFGIDPYDELRVIDCRDLFKRRVLVEPEKKIDDKTIAALPSEFQNQLIHGDSLEQLKKLPDNSVDFAFADPPYNLNKGYTGYSDDLAISEYFEWCDQWLSELGRVLKPGRTCAILNIPLYAIRHFIHLETILNFQNWVVWDALSYPVRLLMPAHYSILFFSKGKPRPLPGLSDRADRREFISYLECLAQGYCLRNSCVEKRSSLMNDRVSIADIWSDVHRLKHNTRRVDHPCQLPPQLMYRLISLLTNEGETVLDCFNGAGTTTLAAHQMKRAYIGIERELSYHEMALERHCEISRGMDPFRKAERELNAKNSPVKRLLKQKYNVPKKTLQLEVRRIAKEIGHLPNRDEVAELARFPIEYYDNYFVSWGEVCAAARTTGMTENRVTDTTQVNLFAVEEGL